MTDNPELAFSVDDDSAVPRRTRWVQSGPRLSVILRYLYAKWGDKPNDRAAEYRCIDGRKQRGISRASRRTGARVVLSTLLPDFNVGSTLPGK